MPDTSVFEDLVADLNGSVYIVTASADGVQAGCLVGFAGQTSISPPRFTVWISDANRTAEVARQASTLVVHVLREHDDQLATLFGTESGDWKDKFESVTWEPGPEGAPVLTRCDWFAGKIVDRIDGVGDHRGYVLEPVTGERRHAGLAPLGYQRVQDLAPGHAA